MKKCCSCLLEKNIEDFWKYSRSSDWLQPRCKLCKREYDNKYFTLMNSEKRQQKNQTSYINTQRKYLVINQYILEKWCIDCWYKDNPAALQFDHISKKNFNIWGSVNKYSLEKIMEEIQLCEVRCANCHCIKTSKDFNWYWNS